MKKLLYISLIVALGFWTFPYFLKQFARYQHKESKFPIQNLLLDQTVSVYLNEYQIPFIEAKTDHDLAFTLALVHAHYRLPQIELSRLISKGELSTVMGFPANGIDQTLRTLQFGKAAEEIIKKFPKETKDWLQAYIDGLNYYIANVKPLPWDAKLLHIDPKPWTMVDLVTMFRMTSSDVNWGYLFIFLTQSKNNEWKDLWNLYIQHSQGSVPSGLGSMLGMQESGSNSLVIAKEKTGTQSSLIASDPHVNVFLPNLWFLCGYKSPTHHAVGLTIPGIPFITLGRNPSIAWGATNMYSISSFLFELKPKDLNHLETFETSIPTRFTKDKKMTIRNSMYGPIISDSPLLEAEKPLALYWLGHQPSDEITPYLQASRATNWSQFEKAFYGYAVLGLNYLYADAEGNIGYVPAFTQPLTKTLEKKMIYPTSEFSPSVIDEAKLSRIYNPKQGFIASSNNRPVEVDRDWGWFYAPNDRVVRQSEFVRSKSKITLDDLKYLQVDTKSLSALSWVHWMTINTDSILQNNQFYQLLSKWDGRYDKEKIQPVIFELLIKELSSIFLQKHFQNPASIKQIKQSLFLKSLLIEYLMELDVNERSKLIKSSLEQIKSKVTSVMNWGQFHPIDVGYVFGALPWIVKAFQIKKLPAPGANDTLYKRAFVLKEHTAPVTYGASARHISDLSDINANYFVLFGAQNGYPFSPDNFNQIELWEQGKYIQIPLEIKKVKQQFTTVLNLTP
jgi:penicillin amidase